MAYVFNPFSGEFDTIVRDGFLPWNYVEAGKIITVPQYRENNTVEELTVLGELVIAGSVYLLNPYDEGFPTESEAYSYNGDGTVNYIEYFSSASQVTANRIYRIDMTYDADLQPLTETHKTYSTADGTTIIKTVTISYTWVSNVLTNKTQVTS